MIRRLFCSLLLIFSIAISGVVLPSGSNCAYSKSLNPGKPDGHEADIYAVLPFKRSVKVSKMILTIHNSIDKPIGYFQGLKNPPHQNFTWHRFGHRVFFHWGFNSDPRSSKILNELVAERKWSSAVTASFWQKVVTEQAIRNKADMECISSVVGYSLHGVEREYVNAMASLIVDTHILGDYTTTETRALQDIDLLAADIKKALFSSLYGGDTAKRINKLIDSTESIKMPANRADAILTILKKEMPQFWQKAQNGKFIEHFISRGLKCK